MTPLRARDPDEIVRPFPRAVGREKQPRSYGRVLRSVREQLQLNSWEMFDRIAREDSIFDLPPPVKKLVALTEMKLQQARKTKLGAGKRKKKPSQELTAAEWKSYTQKRRGKLVNDWERGEQYIPFSIQVRYATIIGTRNGTLHLVSGYYADLRDVCDEEKNQEQKRILADKMMRNLKGLEALLRQYRAFVHDVIGDNSAELPLAKSGLAVLLRNNDATPEEPGLTKYHLYVIQDLLAAYWEGACDHI